MVVSSRVMSSVTVATLLVLCCMLLYVALPFHAVNKQDDSHNRRLLSSSVIDSNTAHASTTSPNSKVDHSRHTPPKRAHPSDLKDSKSVPKLGSSIRFCKLEDPTKVCSQFTAKSLDFTHPEVAMSFLHSCPQNQWKTLFVHDEPQFNFTQKLVKILHSRRRILCPFEDQVLNQTFTDMRINKKIFNRKLGFPQFQSYDLLAALLLSKQTVPATSTGMWLEFGVAEGSSMNITGHSMLHRGLKKDVVEVYGFDSFEGLPYDWVVGEGASQTVKMKKGTFSQGGQFPPVLSNVHLIKGWFEDTLHPFVKQRLTMSEKQQRLVGVNIDNDLYDGARMILEEIRPFMRVGSILHFHELFSSKKENNPMAELRALVEFLGNHTVALDLVPVRSTLDEASAFVVTRI